MGLETFQGSVGKDEIMNVDGNATIWGEGDKLGLQAVGASNNCD